MAIHVFCPSCRAQLSVDDDCFGQQVVCGGCGASVYIAEASFPDLPSRPVKRSRRRTSSIGSAFRTCAQLAISGASLYLGYLMLKDRINPPPPPRAVVQQRSVKPPRVARPHERPRQGEPQVEASPPPLPVVETPQEVVASAFALTEKAANLPPRQDGAVAVLASGPKDMAVQLLTNSAHLRLEGPSVIFTDEKGQRRTVAGVRSHEGQVEFRWTAKVDEAAEAELHNSALALTSGKERHVLALRMPQRVPAEKLDLTRSVYRISSRCDFQPPPADIRFDFRSADALPKFEQEGAAAVGMAVGSETLMHYAIGAEATTRIQLKRTGNVVIAEFDTRYVLPSGDVEPMAVSRGNRILSELESRLEEAHAAPQMLSTLQSHYRQLPGALQRAQAMGTGGNVNGIWVENPVLVGEKTMAISQIQREIAATEEGIAYQQQLIENRPSIQQDLAAIGRIADLSKKLRETKIAYRFYILVAGEEVDLIVAE